MERRVAGWHQPDVHVCVGSGRQEQPDDVVVAVRDGGDQGADRAVQRVHVGVVSVRDKVIDLEGFEASYSCSFNTT